MGSSEIDFGRCGFATGFGRGTDDSERRRLLRLLQRRVDSDDWDGIRRDTSAFLAGVAAGRASRVDMNRGPARAFDFESRMGSLGGLLDETLDATFERLRDSLRLLQA
jgi:hypothetical protein